MKSFISALIVGCYILCCLRLRTAPWKYFQINARLFSRDKGIFSKIAIDKMVPHKWQLLQQRLSDDFKTSHYPVFIKPEWGQNGNGIERADDEHALERIKFRLASADTTYIVQQAATERREFEIFSTFADSSFDYADVVTVTEAINTTDQYPINSINNADTDYRDITHQFSLGDLQRLISYKKEIGKFGQSRLSVRADSLEDLIAGNFHVIELNLFTPMPINLLDRSYTWQRKLKFILRVGRSLARATRAIPSSQPSHPVFTRMMLYSRRTRPIGMVLRSFL